MLDIKIFQISKTEWAYVVTHKSGVLAKGKIEGHPKGAGWEALILNMLEADKEQEDGEDNPGDEGNSE